MKIRTLAATFAAMALALPLAGCGGSDSSGAEPGNCGDAMTWETAASATVAGSATYTKMKQRGHAIVGVKADQPNLGYKDADGKRCGFDIEMARMVSAKLGLDPGKIEYKEVPSANRETALSGGEVDYYVGTYSITDKRKKQVGFAGPYYISGQSLLVRKDDDSIKSKADLKGKKVCSATGSTPIQNVRDQKLTEDSNIVEFKTYSECVSQLLDKKVDTVTTDDAILKGFAANAPDEMKVVGEPFTTEKYGIGLPLNDKALRTKLNQIITASESDGDWKKIYDATLGKSGSPGEAPKVEPY